MSTSLRRRHRDRVVRRGIGLTIESDFYATEAGRAHFADQLTSIRYCVQETCNFDAIFAYLTCGNYDFRYDLQKGLRPRRSVRTAMAHEINMYGIVQKDQMGLDKAIEECKFRMSRYSVTPNMLVVPPQLGLYMSLAPEQKLTYPLGGPAAQAAFDAGLQGFEARAFRGLGVFTSTPYEVSDDQDSVQMLQRSSQVGEFYRMSPPAVFNDKQKLPGSYMDIMVYDEESDRHVHIEFKTALKATVFGAVDNSTPAIKGDPFKLIGRTLGVDNKDPDVKRSDDHYDNINTNNKPTKLSGLIEAYKQADATGTKNQAEFATGLKDLVDAGVWVPVEIVICRPFIEHLTLSAIVAVAGRDTGATLFGPADMQISVRDRVESGGQSLDKGANTSVKTIEGHYTCHTKSVITKPQNVYVMRDVMCSGYVAGCNTRFFGEKKTREDKNDGAYNPESIRESINERLSFQNDAEGEYESMLAFAAPYGDGAKRDQVISITPRLLPWEVNRSEQRKDYFPGSDEGWKLYERVYALDTVHYGEDVRAAENMEFITQGSMNNGLCFVGPHRKYNPFSNKYHELIPGQGHFGPDAIPGDARWRRGEAVSLKAARDSMVSIEAAAQSQMFLTKGD